MKSLNSINLNYNMLSKLNVSMLNSCTKLRVLLLRDYSLTSLSTLDMDQIRSQSLKIDISGNEIVLVDAELLTIPETFENIYFFFDYIKPIKSLKWHI